MQHSRGVYRIDGVDEMNMNNRSHNNIMTMNSGNDHMNDMMNCIMPDAMFNSDHLICHQQQSLPLPPPPHPAQQQQQNQTMPQMYMPGAIVSSNPSNPNRSNTQDLQHITNSRKRQLPQHQQDFDNISVMSGGEQMDQMPIKRSSSVAPAIKPEPGNF